MAKLVMERKATDNPYFHREFHNHINVGIDYLYKKYGPEKVVDYLETFTRHFYGPLIERMKAEGLSPFREHLEKIYEIEGALGDLHIEESEEGMKVSVYRCPGVTYIHETGHTVSEVYPETSRVVYKTLAEDTGFTYEMRSYDEETGKAVHLFRKG